MGKNKGNKNQPPPEEEKNDGGKKGGKKDKKKGGYLAQMEEEERQAKEAAQKQADLKNRFKFVKAKHILISDESVANDLLEKLTAEFGTNPGPPEKTSLNLPRSTQNVRQPKRRYQDNLVCSAKDKWRLLLRRLRSIQNLCRWFKNWFRLNTAST